MSAAKVIVSGISGRYALALFDLAKEKDALQDVENDLNALSAMLDESDDLRAVVTSPLFSRDEQGKAVSALAAAAKLKPIVQNFLGVLAANRRLRALSAIIGDYGRLMADHRGELTATVTSARALSDDQQAALAAKLKLASGQDVKIDVAVDESLLGGLVVKLGSRMIDSSLKTKLNNLELAMKGV